jgi:hypothetical protein
MKSITSVLIAIVCMAAVPVSHSCDAKEAVPAIQVGKNNFLQALKLKQKTAFRFSPGYGFIAGDQDGGVLMDVAGVTFYERTSSGVKLLETDKAIAFKHLELSKMTNTNLAKMFPGIYQDPAGKKVISDVLSAVPVAVIYKPFSPSKISEMYAITKLGFIYYFHQSSVDAPTFARLIPIAMPKFVASQKPAAASMSKQDADKLLNSLPPCSEGKYPCRD